MKIGTNFKQDQNILIYYLSKYKYFNINQLPVNY